MNRSQQCFVSIGVALALLGAAAPKAHAVCRVLGPTEESGEHGVAFDSVTQALYVVAPEQVVGFRCRDHVPDLRIDGNADLDGRIGGYDYPVPVGEADTEAAGPSYESPFELELDLPDDIGVVAEGSTLGFGEGGHRRLIDGGVLEAIPQACRDGALPDPVYGTLVHTVVQPALYAMGGRGGLVMPLPARADVHVAPSAVFSAAAQSAQARVTETVTYVEDGGLGFQCTDPHYSTNMLDAVLGLPMMMMGCSAGYGGEADNPFYEPDLERRDTETEETRSGRVAVDRIETTEEYEVVVLNASNLDALTEWLDANEFSWNEEDEAAFASYVKEGAWFLAIRVEAPELPGSERVALAPLVVTWRGEEIPVMNRLQYSAAGGVVETDAFIIAPTRMAVEDGDGVIDIASPAVFEDPALRVFGLSEGWITRIRLQRRVDEVKDDSRLVPSYSGEVDPLLIERRRTVRVAQACCPGNSYPFGGEREFVETYEYIEGQGSPAPDFYIAPPYTEAQCQSTYTDYAPADDYDYACSVRQPSRPARGPSRVTMALSWLPLFAVVLGLRRRRRR